MFIRSKSVEKNKADILQKPMTKTYELSSANEKLSYSHAF